MEGYIRQYKWSIHSQTNNRDQRSNISLSIMESTTPTTNFLLEKRQLKSACGSDKQRQPRHYYPCELKRKVVEAVLRGENCSEVVRKFGLRNNNSIHRFLTWYYKKERHELVTAPKNVVLQTDFKTHDVEWLNSQAEDNLKLMDKLQDKTASDSSRLTPKQTALLKSMLDFIMKQQVSAKGKDDSPVSTRKRQHNERTVQCKHFKSSE